MKEDMIDEYRKALADALDTIHRLNVMVESLRAAACANQKYNASPDGASETNEQG